MLPLNINIMYINMPLQHNNLLVKCEYQLPNKCMVTYFMNEHDELPVELLSYDEKQLQQCLFFYTETHTVKNDIIPSLQDGVLLNFKQFVKFLCSHSNKEFLSQLLEHAESCSDEKHSSHAKVSDVFYTLYTLMATREIDPAKTFVGIKLLSANAHIATGLPLICSVLVYSAPLQAKLVNDDAQPQQVSMNILCSPNACYTYVYDDIELAFYMRFSKCLGIYDILDDIVNELYAQLDDTIAHNVKLRDAVLSVTTENAHTKLVFEGYEDKLCNLSNLLSAIYNCVHHFTEQTEISDSRKIAVHFFVFSNSSLRFVLLSSTQQYYVSLAVLLDNIRETLLVGHKHSLELPAELQIDYFARFNIACNSIMCATRECVRLTFAFGHEFFQEYCRRLHNSEQHKFYLQIAQLVHNECSICDTTCDTFITQTDELLQTRQCMAQVLKHTQDDIYIVHENDFFDFTIPCDLFVLQNVTQECVTAYILHELKGILHTRTSHKIYVPKHAIKCIQNKQEHAGVQHALQIDEQHDRHEHTLCDRVVHNVQRLCNIM